jgi:predicted adenine nucleotide alpha hydrolase (AANH) superfamily ATPase
METSLFWYNPNIHPYTEYAQRRDCFYSFADNENLNIIKCDKYDLRAFLGKVFPVAAECSNLRCQTCYRMRLEKTAIFAMQQGYSIFSTSLLISPYQDHKVIKQIGKETATNYGVEFLYKDFRPLFREGQAVARLDNMYMQKYCGCIFSEEERYLNKPRLEETQ